MREGEGAKLLRRLLELLKHLVVRERPAGKKMSSKISSASFNRDKTEECRATRDDVVVELDGLYLRVSRAIPSDYPHEVTVVVPRAEIRKRFINGHLCEVILTYSSITVSHSPRHPSKA